MSALLSAAAWVGAIAGSLLSLRSGEGDASIQVTRHGIAEFLGLAEEPLDAAIGAAAGQSEPLAYRGVDVGMVEVDGGRPATRLNFLRSMGGFEGKEVVLPGRVPEGLSGATNYRIVPGTFPTGMDYHFDGLASILRLSFKDGHLSYMVKAYESRAHEDYSSCLFLGTGTGPKIGAHVCLANPAVNILPIEGQLWLTIDTRLWGRVDPATLETLPSKVRVNSTVLNAHPACDSSTGDCFVQYNCGPGGEPFTRAACIARLQPQQDDMQTEEVSRAYLPEFKLIQHSHSPCVTQHFVVAKLDSFVPRDPVNDNAGMLKILHQAEDDVWMVMDRRTNHSRIMRSSGHSFVNNHFWNCVEDETGEVVVDTVTATSDYLDVFFGRELDRPSARWAELFHPVLRCVVPPTGDQIVCEPYFKDPQYLDYPTYNPLYKMRRDYRFWYAVAARSSSSKWLDEIVKVDAHTRSITARWHAEGVYVTEADFVPRVDVAEEDAGYLISILYNATADESAVAIFETRTMTLIQQFPMGFVVPFHAHGVICVEGARCYTNP